MIPALIGAGISAGASLYGASLDRKAADKTFEKNAALQREFAQNGVSWKVEDAKRAGIHPAFALGAPTVSASPVSVGSTSMASVMGGIGQDVSRAIQSTATQGQRASAFDQTVRQLTVQKMGLENELLASQIARTNQTGPAMPIGSKYLLDGQGQSSGVTTSPMERTASSAAAPWQEPGSINDVGYARTATGLAPIPSKDVKERIEDNLPQEIMWMLRNQFAPSLPLHGGDPPRAPLPKGHDGWVYNPLSQEYQPMRYPKFLGRFGKYFAY